MVKRHQGAQPPRQDPVRRLDDHHGRAAACGPSCRDLPGPAHRVTRDPQGHRIPDRLLQGPRVRCARRAQRDGGREAAHHAQPLGAGRCHGGGHRCRGQRSAAQHPAGGARRRRVPRRCHVIGEDWKRPADTQLEANRKEVDRFAYDATTDAEVESRRKAKAVPFGGRIDPGKVIDQAPERTFMPRRVPTWRRLPPPAAPWHPPACSLPSRPPPNCAAWAWR